MENKLVVGNKIQRALFIGELAGQISDGQWENARPYEHFHVWCNLDSKDIIIAQGTEQVGRNFWAVKSNYNLTAPDLLEAVGNRMIWLIKLVMVSEAVENLVLAGSHWTLFENLDLYVQAHSRFLAGKASEYEADAILKLAQAGITLETYQQADAYKFTMADLKNNLRGLSVAMKSKIV